MADRILLRMILRQSKKVLQSDFLTQGQSLPKFENSICDYTTAKYAIGVNSGTSALHLACRALGLKEGDILWTSAITFASSANCGLFCGARVDFVDIDPYDWNLSAENLEIKLKKSCRYRRSSKNYSDSPLCGFTMRPRKDSKYL